MKKPNPAGLVGRSPEQLEIPERFAFAGYWIALEIYDPKTLPLRDIQAVGPTRLECVAELVRRGLDPARFELTMLARPY